MENQKEEQSVGNKKGTNYRFVLLIISIFLIGLGILSPAMATTGYFEEFQLPFTISLAAGLLSGIIIGILFSFIFKSTALLFVINSILGLVYGLCTFLAIYFYIGWRGSFFRIELILPLVVGGLPVLLLIILKQQILRVKINNNESHE